MRYYCKYLAEYERNFISTLKYSIILMKIKTIFSIKIVAQLKE
jgi:hypothetical protein